MKSCCRIAVGVVLSAVVLTTWAGSAQADVVQPPGACVGTGTWEGAGFTESSVDHDRSDIIEVPRADTVTWEGSVGGAGLTEEVPRRQIEGHVNLVLPPPFEGMFGPITIDDWGPNSSVRAANTGTHDYDLPKVLVGVTALLHGIHTEDTLSCEGEVYVQIEGSAFSNPAAVASLAFSVLFGGLTLVAGRPRFTPIVGP